METHIPKDEIPWHCSICNEVFPVLTLARLCEKKHKREGWYYTWKRRLPVA
jgi:hypothetical protein